MANVLKVKRNAWNASGGNAAAPVADALEYGELAWENTTGTLYIGKQINSGGTINSKRVIPDASATVIGAASFSTNNFVVNSGAVQIKDTGVATEELADDAVTGAKIAADAVDSEHIAADSIDSEHYAAGSVDATALAANSVDSSELVDGSIDTSHIGDNQVTAAKIADDTTFAGDCGTTGSFTVGTNLIVQGDTTTLNTSTLTVEDIAIEVAKNATDSSTSDGAGIVVGGWSGCPTILYDHTGTQWEFNKPIEAQSGFNNSTFDGGTYTNP